MKNYKHNKNFKKRTVEEKLYQDGTCLTVRLREGESSDNLVARFKRKYKRTGLHDEIRNAYLGYHKTKSEKKREKHSRALKRFKKSQR